MICLKCDNKYFETILCKFNPVIKGKEINVSATAFVCVNCSFKLMDTGQMEYLRNKANEVYETEDCLKNGVMPLRYITDPGSFLKCHDRTFEDNDE